jgi:hypothetical protein
MFRRAPPSESIDISRISKDAPVVNFTEKPKGRPKKVKEEIKEEVKIIEKAKPEKKKMPTPVSEPEIPIEIVEVKEEPKKSKRLVKGSPEALEWARQMSEKRKTKRDEMKKAAESKE